MCVSALNTHEATPGDLNLFLLDLSAKAAIQFVLFLPSHASFIFATSISLLQSEGHLTYNCDEPDVLALSSSAMFWCGSGCGSTQHALSLQWLT